MKLYTKIFLADDDVDDRDLFTEALMEIDPSLEFFYASNGEAALLALQADMFEKPEIIFLDINMPKINGKELLKRIKSTDELSGIPVIMYSTNFNEQDISEILQAGAAHHLIKHTDFKELRTALKKYS